MATLRNLMAFGLILVAAVYSSGTQAASLEQLVMPGPVSEAHADIETECSACHSPLEEKPQHELCATCHESVGQDLASGNGFHGKHPQVREQQCQSCHAEHEGRDAQTLTFDMQAFDHSITDFPLQWAHSGLECKSCHQPEIAFHEAPQQCQSCHAEDDVHNGGLGNDCGSCHTERSWTSTAFDHANTGFNLTGAHEALTCASCHADDNFNSADSQCVSCHKNDDPHKGALGNQCQQCHNTSNWSGSSFDHARQTGFALLQGHAGLACEACHEAGISLDSATSECSSCHAKDDVHEGKNGSDCGSCHTVADWKSSTFDHTQVANFTLMGAHEQLSCDSCHTGPVSDPLPTTCSGCHTEDPHEGQLSNRCENCHNNLSWVFGVRFDHDLSPFPLLGKHKDLICLDCHLDKRFHDVEGECSSCHQSEDVHMGAFGNQCESCHQPGGWQQTSFDHAQLAGFALQGAHESLSCESCHSKPHMLEASEPSQCSQCHAQDDPHGNRFGSDCAQCHTTTDFERVKGY